MATTFHHFSNLPTELRIQIWALTVGPRILHIRVINKSKTWNCFDYSSPNPPLAILHVQTSLEA
ncbi:hypothetical protein GGR51DRAFT_510977 [Nemania sp. FL0031]|nr:hypothetical protein GGR51DRAFT_510977 [Nemania sp. FL0031]